MRAQDIMTTPVIAVRPETSVQAAAAELAARGFTALPVVDDDAQLVGIVTEADLIRNRFPADARHYLHDGGRRHHPLTPPTTVCEAMSSPVTSMGPRTDLADMAMAMLRSRQRSMPIVEGCRLVGIVTRSDLVRTVARDDQSIAADVRHRLEIYGGPNRWKVHANDGVVSISGRVGDETDRHVAAVLAEAVPGVVRAQVIAEGVDS